LSFQARTGARGLVACHSSTIAPEAKKRKHLREPFKEETEVEEELRLILGQLETFAVLEHVAHFENF